MKKTLLNILYTFLCLGLVSLASADESVTYFHLDSLGSPIASSDANGNIIWTESFSPHGKTNVNAYESVDNRRGFTGHVQDESEGLVYMGSRYYDPEIGRFNAFDPVAANLENPQSFNRYAYANNNPYMYVDPNGESPLDAGFFFYDAVMFGIAVGTGVGVAEAGVNLAESTVGLISPVPGTGLALKAKRLAKAEKVIDGASKPDFIVSPKGTTMPTNKDFNLVDSKKKGGDWFQIHNKHTDAKVDGSPHTHFPKQHDGSRTREIKRTDGGDLDHADNKLRSGAMRERRKKGDKGG